MKNIIKTVIVMLTSISLFGSANAGELAVSGTAKATYNILSGNATNQGKGLGITNELNFTASGELDNGYTWSYSMELDPGAANAAGTAQGTTGENQDAQNDDTKLTLTTPYGTVGVFISEGGLDVEDAASQSTYGRPTDIGDPSSGAGDNYTIDSYNNLQYHTPADLLPFGITGKVAYAPDLHAYGSGNNKGSTITKSTSDEGRSAQELQVKATAIPMLDGLTVGASYFEFNEGGQTKNDQLSESGAYYATYATGPFSVGYSQAYKAPMIADGVADDSDSTIEFYDQTNMSIAYAATDNLSVSYETESDEINYVTATQANLEQKSKSIQVAYTMGGMTLALAHGSYDNAGYTADKSVDQTLFAVTMAF
jgi:hypothetical protein